MHRVLKRMVKRLVGLSQVVCSGHAGVPRGVLGRAQDTDRDFFMGAEEAVEYGLVDAVISKPQMLAAAAAAAAGK